MQPFLIPLIFLGWPLAEIAGFVVVGQAIGLWATLGLVVGSGLLGVFLLRSQGLHLLRQISNEQRQGRVPGRQLVDGAMIVVAGILLLLPGFISDIIGLTLFLPPVRAFIWSAIGQRIVVVQSAGPDHQKDPPRSPPEKTIDLAEEDFHRDSGSSGSSPWYKPPER